MAAVILVSAPEPLLIIGVGAMMEYGDLTNKLAIMVPVKSSAAPGVVLPIPTFPIILIYNALASVEEVILSIAFPAAVLMASCALGEVVPMPTWPLKVAPESVEVLETYKFVEVTLVKFPEPE